MFYSVEILRLRKAKKGRLPFCWIASMNRPESKTFSTKKNQPANFVGTGLLKVSKKNVEEVDVEAACNDIMECLVGEENKPRFSLYLASHLTYGLLRIYQEQVRSLEEETEKLFTDIIGSGKGEGGTTGKKNRKEKNQDVALLQIDDSDVTNEFNEYQLFPENRSDQHQLVEIEPIPIHHDFELPLDFGDTGNLDDIRLVPSASFLEGIDNEINQETQEQPQYGYQMQGEVFEQDPVDQEQIQRHSILNGPEEHFVAQPEFAQLDDRAHTDLQPPVENMDIDLQGDAIPTESNQSKDPRSPRGIMAPPESFVTPKRKSRRPHDETPTKRTKTVSDYSAPDMDHHRKASSLSESSPVPRPPKRSLFPNSDKQADNDLDLAAVPQGASERRKGSSPQIIEPVNESILVEDEYYVPQNGQPEGPPQLQLPADQSEGQSLDSFELAPLESLATPKRRKKSKKTQSNVFDEVRQIKLVIDDTLIHTRPYQPIRPKVLGKVTANQLLAVPATGIIIDPVSHTATRNWAGSLIGLFNNHIKDTCDIPLNISKPSPREISMKKLPRLSKTPSKRQNKSVPVTSEPTTPARSSTKLTTPPGFGVEHSPTELITDMVQDDAALMPPPNEVSQQSSIPLTPTRDRSPAHVRPKNLPSPHQQVQLADTVPDTDDTYLPGRRAESSERLPITSPVQARPRSLPSPHQQIQLADTAPETDDTFLPRRRAESSERLPSVLPDSESPRRNDLIMTSEEFYEVLVRMWGICAAYRQRTNVSRQLEFDDILPPGETSIQELITYFMYCCNFEKNTKLHLEQDVPYEGVSIIELGDERE